MSKITSAMLDGGMYQDFYNAHARMMDYYGVPDEALNVEPTVEELEASEKESAEIEAMFAEVDATELAKNPLHYKEILPGYQYMDTMEHLLGYEGTVAHLRGQIYKYMMRYGSKDPVLQESKKISWYAVRLEDVEKRYAEGNFPCKPSTVKTVIPTEVAGFNIPDDDWFYGFSK